MTKRLLFSTLVILLVAGLSLAGEKEEKEKAWTGWVTDNHCAAKGAKAGHADCARSCVKNMGAKFALYITADGKVYVLDPQAKAEEHAGQYVKVKGTLEGDTIKVASIEQTGEQEEKEKEKPKSQL